MPSGINALTSSQTVRLQTGQDIELQYIDITWRGCSRDSNDQQPGHQSLLGPRALALDICAGVDMTTGYTPQYRQGAPFTYFSADARYDPLSGHWRCDVVSTRPQPPKNLCWPARSAATCSAPRV